MLYREFGKLGWNVSAIGMGTWNIGNQWGELDDATAFGAVRAAYDQGMNLFDTAESYGIPNGLSEERLGVALSGIRHDIVLVSKIGHWGERTGGGVPKTTVDLIRLCCHASLGRLRTDWIDVELCHEGNIEDPSVYLEAFEALKAQGRIRAYGISTNDLEVLKRFNVHGTCSVLEVDYSLLNRAPESDILPYCEQHGIAVLVRGPLRRGLLAGKYKPGAVFTDPVRAAWHDGGAQQGGLDRELAIVQGLSERFAPGNEMVTAALRYVISQPAAPVAIPGCKSATQAIMNAAAGGRMLTPGELATISELLS
jgi:aryl-alcohol dehydrogenase-like predicted oxidoreductase